MRVLLLLTIILATSVPAFSQIPKAEPLRAWKTAEGAAFTATVLEFDGKEVVFKMPTGQSVKAALGKLSAEDQAWLAEWQKRRPIKVTMPDEVGVESANMKAEVVSEDAAGEKFVYRTPHFEFESQGKFNTTLLREVARNFEATYELVKALPWGIEPTPASGEYFKAHLFKNKEAYYSAGAPANSGGVYMGDRETFFVPFENIGVKLVGKSYAKDENFTTHTMVHELTHEMMNHWLRSLPQWIVEGTAEYTGTMPLKTGKFRVSAAKNGLKDYVEFLKKRAVGGMPEPYPLDQLFRITNEQWNETLASTPTASHRLYFTSYLLVYYFMHLDGAGDGQHFVRFFRAIGETRKVGARTDEAAALAALNILLDGRSDADLMKQIRSAYAKLGIRL